MIESLGIIPAAGKAERFGGVMKELLPVGEETLLWRVYRTLTAAPGVPDVVIVTSTDKIRDHAIAMHEMDVLYRIQSGQQDALGALIEGITISAERYYYAYPDVYTVVDWPDDDDGSDLTIWTFETNTPKRFGCLHGGKIHDKVFSTGVFMAYGAMAWSTRVRDFWIDNEHKYNTHTDAFNAAIARFGYTEKNLPYYYDMASWGDYQRLVRDVL